MDFSVLIDTPKDLADILPDVDQIYVECKFSKDTSVFIRPGSFILYGIGPKGTSVVISKDAAMTNADQIDALSQYLHSPEFERIACRQFSERCGTFPDFAFERDRERRAGM